MTITVRRLKNGGCESCGVEICRAWICEVARVLEDGDPVPLLWTTKPSIPMRLRPLKPHPKLGIRSFQRCRIDPNFCWPSQSRFFFSLWGLDLMMRLGEGICITESLGVTAHVDRWIWWWSASQWDQDQGSNKAGQSWREETCILMT